MKVFFDGVIFSLQNSGGISVYYDELINGLRERDVQTEILLYKNESSHVENFCVNNKARLHINVERFLDVKMPSEARGIFHSSYYRLPSNKNLKIITTLHDFTYEKFVKGPAQWVHTWQKNRAIQNSDIIICVSNNTAQDLMEYCYVDESRVRVVHNGVSEIYHPLSQISDFNNSMVLFVGARGGYKNFHLAIEAVAAIPDLELHVVGGGAFSSDELQQLEKQLPGRYRWLGRLSDEALNKAYNRAYALLYPSSYEGFGIPIIEAMRAGCPVVAVNVSSIPEVAGDAAILVDLPSASALSDALRFVSARRQQLITAGMAQAAKFSWARCINETLAVYNELL